MRCFLSIAAVFVAMITVSIGAHADDGFSDASLGFRYGTDFREPAATDAAGHAVDIAKRIYNFTYVDGNRYGGDLLVVDGYLSDSADPNKSGDGGEHEVYVVYRHTFSLGALIGSDGGFGPVRTTDVVAGVDLNTKDTAYAPRKRMFVVGPQFEFAVSRGFFKASLLAEKEYDHNGIVGRAENFDTTWAVESSWLVPFAAATLPLRFEGYLGIYGPKGRDDFGADTKTETLFHPRVMADLGALAGTKGRIFAGLGYEYWYNKYGVDHSLTPGATQHTVMLEVALHL